MGDALQTLLRWWFAASAPQAAGDVDELVAACARRGDQDAFARIIDHYDHRLRGREQRVLTDSRPPAQVVNNLPPGPPDQAVRPSVLRRNVASVVRAFLTTTGEVPVTEVTEHGRPAWRLVTPVAPNKLAGPGNSADQLEVIVDQDTGFPLRVTETLTGRFLHEVRLSNLIVDGPVDSGSFTIEFPTATQPFRQDAGFRAVPLSQARAAVGYQPVLPRTESLPPGFQLAEVTVATSAQAPDPRAPTPSPATSCRSPTAAASTASW